jgi:hypothetical protein
MYTEYPDEYYDLVDQMVATGRFGGRPEAAAEVRRLRPDLVCQPTPTRHPAIATTRSGGLSNVERELDRLAREHHQRKPQLTFSQAYVEVLMANSALYSRYLGERAAQQRNPASG